MTVNIKDILSGGSRQTAVFYYTQNTVTNRITGRWTRYEGNITIYKKEFSNMDKLILGIVEAIALVIGEIIKSDGKGE